MSQHNHAPGRRLTLAERLRQLNDNLLGLGRRLRDAIAAAISATVSDVTRDGVRRLLDQLGSDIPVGDDSELEHQRRRFDRSRFGDDRDDRDQFRDDHFGGRHTDDRSSRSSFSHDQYSDESGGWQGEQDDELMGEDRLDRGFWSGRDHESVPEPEAKPDAPRRPTGRLDFAVTTAVAAGTWWLRRNQARRPVLTTVAVAVAAGVMAFFAGPATAAGLGIVSSVGGLLMTADTIGSATAGLASLVGG